MRSGWLYELLKFCYKGDWSFLYYFFNHSVVSIYQKIARVKVTSRPKNWFGALNEFITQHIIEHKDFKQTFTLQPQKQAHYHGGLEWN